MNLNKLLDKKEDSYIECYNLMKSELLNGASWKIPLVFSNLGGLAFVMGPKSIKHISASRFYYLQSQIGVFVRDRVDPKYRMMLVKKGRFCYGLFNDEEVTLTLKTNRHEETFSGLSSNVFAQENLIGFLNRATFDAKDCLTVNLKITKVGTLRDKLDESLEDESYIVELKRRLHSAVKGRFTGNYKPKSITPKQNTYLFKSGVLSAKNLSPVEQFNEIENWIKMYEGRESFIPYDSVDNLENSMYRQAISYKNFMKKVKREKKKEDKAK